MSLMIAVTVIGNVLVVTVISLNRRLRTRENVFVVSLAVSDLLVGAQVMLLAVPADILDEWIHRDSLCYLWVVVDITCTTSSIFSICAISLTRYLKIQKPYRYTGIVTKRVVTTMLALIWIVPTTVTVSLYDVVHHEARHCHKGRWQCDLRHTPLLAIYSILSYFLPCLVMIYIYRRLYALCRQHLLHITVTCPYRRARRDFKTVLTIGVVMGTFLACWVPVQTALLVHVTYSLHNIPVPDLLYKVVSWLGYSNSMMDPIVYSLMNKEFRKTFREAITLNRR